jgi:septal ring factor EnvC (AmiA/AmiB activator)
MSEQTTVTYSLEAVLKEIVYNQKELNTKLEANQKETSSKLEALAIGQARLEEKLEGLTKRIESQEFISRGVLLTLLATVLGGAAKMFGLI